MLSERRLKNRDFIASFPGRKFRHDFIKKWRCFKFFEPQTQSLVTALLKPLNIDMGKLTNKRNDSNVCQRYFLAE